MLQLTIDDRQVSVPEEYTLYQAALELGLEIPTLCFHKALIPYGACRVCLVEIESGGRSQLVASCAYPVQEGLVVRTDTPLIDETRKVIMELLLARAPNVPVIKELAARYGVTDTLLKKKDDKCIMCGLCVRVCHEVVGRAATCFSSRGYEREVLTPYKQVSDVCIGCGACSLVCPTDAVDPEDYCGRELEDIPNEFNCGLDSRTAIHLPFPQAVPNKPILDRDNCIYYQTGGCQACGTVCQADAISYDKEDEFVTEKVGAVIMATGYELVNPAAYEEYGYGRYPDVITSLEFERMVSASGPTGGNVRRPSDGEEPKTVVFVQCVGSREEVEPHKPYCSNVCCMYTAKHTMLMHHKVHDAKIFVFFMDIRSSGKNYEQFVRRVSKEKIASYLRGRVSKVFPKHGKLIVRGADTLSESQVEIEADMVVLAAAVQPSSGITELAQKFRVGYDEHGFLMEAHPKLKPVETNTAGLFLAGMCHSPRDIPESVSQASGAAAKALGLINFDEYLRDPTVARVNTDTCNACFECENVCAYKAITQGELRNHKGEFIKKIADINEGLCQGCGACAVTCRSNSIEVAGFTDEQLYGEINALADLRKVVQGDGEEWQPIVCSFLCNWCSYAGADLAGMSRLEYPANIHIVKVPCSGKVDPVFILKAFERGADLVSISGCHPGDCHYSTGNYHARRKLKAFRQMLGFMGIDPRRMQVSWVSAAEGAKWADVAKNITSLARELGPFEYFEKTGVMVGNNE
jgi:coenzyme F420-reducing hydrogenase delta subunit/ferredoxin